MINEGLAIIGHKEVNSNWSKIPIKDHTYNRTDDWFKKGSLTQDLTKSLSPVDHFKEEA